MLEKNWDTTERKELEEEISGYFGQESFVEDKSGSNDNNDKLSQLRLLLEKKLKSSEPNLIANSAFTPTTNEDNKFFQNNCTANSSNSLSQRRRVSFNPLVVQENANSNSTNLHSSPGNRKRHFSFQPISPRQNSLPQSPSVSPFISPRSTPVPMLRSRHSSGSALPLHLLPQGQESKNWHGSCSASSDISRAATRGSNSECSTPFISPHGTPIPFNRSRHNSAQGRLCRSRHSSGLTAPNRPYSMPFSPMALSNLNNPYSPQPSTPLAPSDMEVASSDPIRSFHMGNRSRHSSAESEPAIFQGGIDKNTESLKRQRHASAGNIPTDLDRTAAWCENASLGPSFTSEIRQSDAINASYADKIVDGKKEPIPDDLDIALSALKDCDKDFSKFVQESETK